MEKLGSDQGCPELGLPALGSFLWSREAVADLAGCDLANADLLDAIRALAFTIEGKTRRAVDYKNLGSEELGSIYESLLELHPELNTDGGYVRAENGRRPRAEDDRKLLHAGEPGRVPARLGARPGSRRGRQAARPRGGDPQAEGLRPGRRQRPLPDRRGPPDRQAAGGRADGR